MPIDLKEKVSAEEEKFRAEITRATEQLETIRKQVLEQVSVAQKSKEKTEFRLEIAGKEKAQLSAEVQKLRTDLALQSELREQMLKANAKNESNLERLSTERDSIVHPPGIPLCRNCDLCLRNSWCPRAACNACLFGDCEEDPPIT
jgi:hypothetical protein